MTEVFRLDDFEELARAALSEPAFAYYAGGAADERTMRANIEAFSRRTLRPRVLVDVSNIDPTTSLLDVDVPMPVCLAPNAGHGFAHPEGECATARAADRAGVLMCLSTMSNRSLEDVAAAGSSPKWFQLYMHPDRAVSEAMVKRAAAAGYRAIVLTADLPVPGYRERELRHPVPLDGELPFGNFIDEVPAGGDMLEFLNATISPSVTWDDFDWLREITDLPVVLKGVLTAEDATLAVEHGAAGIVVSNHGGRQLDRTPASLEVLEVVVDAVRGRAEVYLDGGVRRGTDVAIALALGARAVFIGRPYLFALAALGEDGVLLALQLIEAELRNAMALLGTRSVSEITRAHVRP